MTLLLIEGFDHYANYQLKGWQSYAPGSSGWADTLGVSSPGRVAGGQCMKISVRSTGNIGAFATDRSIYKLLPVASTEVIMGFGILTDTNVPPDAGFPSGSNLPFVNLITTSKVAVARFYLNNTQIPIVAGIASAQPHTHGVWTYYEIRAKVNGASSEIEMQRNGGPDVPTTVVNLGTTPIMGIEFGTHALNSERYFFVDDVYCLDTTGPAPNNTFLGDVRIETLYPNAPGGHADWARSAGTINWALVNEHPPDDDTTYVTSNTPADKDSYNFTDLTATGVVYGVQTNLIARKTTSGFKQIRTIVREAGVDYPGSPKTMAAAYNWYGHIFETDPAGGQWNTAKVDAAEFGVEVIV